MDTVAISSSPSTRVGRRKFTLRSRAVNPVPAGAIVWTAAPLALLASRAMTPPKTVSSSWTRPEWEVLARAQDDRKARALAEVAIGHLEAMRGNFDRARLLYRRSRASLEEFGYLFSAALTSLDSAAIELLAGDLAAAESELRTDYRRLEGMGERNYISTTAGLLADVLYRQSRYDESAEFAGPASTSPPRTSSCGRRGL